MNRMPSWLRVTGGALLCIVLTISLLHPMLTQGECAALIALSNRGKTYVFGTEGPDVYDCSGLTKDAYAYLNVELIHSAKYVAYDAAYAQIDSVSRLKPGDLVFFDTVRDSDPYDHVGIWLGMNRFVHASSSEKAVMISNFDEKWQNCYSGARRVLPAALTQIKS